MTAASAAAHAVDVRALPAMLTALRLPSFHRHWPTMAERAPEHSGQQQGQQQQQQQQAVMR